MSERIDATNAARLSGNTLGAKLRERTNQAKAAIFTTVLSSVAAEAEKMADIGKSSVSIPLKGENGRKAIATEIIENASEIIKMFHEQDVRAEIVNDVFEINWE
jgi:hypothetical protein